MPNVVIKPETVVQAAWLLLQREIVLPALTNRRISKTDIQYSANDTVQLSVPAIVDATTEDLRSTDALDFGNFAETSVDVKLDKRVYSGLNVTDVNLTLDIRSFVAQVLAPQMRAVVEGMENRVADAMEAATPLDVVSWAPGDDPYVAAVAARKALNTANVPKNGRYIVLGADAEEAFLVDDRISKAMISGDAQAVSALKTATIGNLAGFTVLTSNALAPGSAFAFQIDAIAFISIAPAVPQGAPWGAQQSSEGLGLTVIRDYDPTYATDRSFVHAFVGAQSVETGPEGNATNKRLVRIGDFS